MHPIHYDSSSRHVLHRTLDLIVAILPPQPHHSLRYIVE
jgi:hypothetical protein